MKKNQALFEEMKAKYIAAKTREDFCEVGALMREMRERRFMTISAAAKAVRTTGATLAGWEWGRMTHLHDKSYYGFNVNRFRALISEDEEEDEPLNAQQQKVVDDLMYLYEEKSFHIFGQKLKALRVRLCLSQEKAAARIGVSSSLFRKWEKGSFPEVRISGDVFTQTRLERLVRNEKLDDEDAEIAEEPQDQPPPSQLPFAVVTVREADFISRITEFVSGVLINVFKRL